MISFFLSGDPLEFYTEKEIQNIIQQNEKIHQIDCELNAVYSLLKDFSTQEEKQDLKKEQRLWIKERNKLEGEDVFYAAYTKRLESLVERVRNKEKPIMAQIITDKPNIDKKRAASLLRNCPTLNCQAYAIYFESQKISSEEEKKK